MGDLEKAALTAFFTVLVFVVGQFLQKFILEPVQEQRRLIGEVAFALVFYANVSTRFSAPEEKDEAQKSVRKLSAQLRATLWTIPFYNLLAALHIVPKREAINRASTGLIGFSNSFGEGSTRDIRDEIADALKIDWKA